MKLLQPFAIALLMSLLTAVAPAWAASESGSHGWSRQPLTLRSGPGHAYGVTGQIAEDTAIKVLRCQALWCVVDGPGGRGWTGKDRIGFGQTSADPLTGPRLGYGAGGPGTVCFYEGTHYSGRSLCAGPGQVFNDLALWGFDNGFSSVEVSGNVSAAACRDRQFQSYCERVVESQPVLDRFLNDNLSSIRVY